MRVLHLCPLWYPVAPDAPGGIETFLSQLIAELEALGCRNTLIASGDSRVAGEVLPAVEIGLCAQMAAGTALEYAYYEQHQLSLTLEYAAEFDLVHSHIGSAAYALSAFPGFRTRMLHTQHSPVYSDLEWFVRQHPDLWLSTVSEFQARKLWRQGATHCEVIPNGIDMGAFPFSPRGGGGLLFIGRLERVKGPDVAVRVARALGQPLALAGPIVEPDYFDRALRPFLDDQIRYLGVVDHRQKCELYGQADCALLPFLGEEPFGLVTIEAMASGTPVVTLATGALPEIVEPGLTGYLARSEGELTAMVRQALTLDRAAVRARAAAKFDIAAVAQRYHRLYARMCDTAGPRPSVEPTLAVGGPGK